MKKLFFTFILIGLTGLAGMAQSRSHGVYLNFNQFDNERPEYSNDATTRIQLNTFLGGHYITIRHDGKKTRLYKDDIYAYKTSKGKIFRYWNGQEYRLLEKGDIWIYYRDLNTALGKGIKRERKYYFSVSGKDEVLALTRQNLKQAFPNKHLFKNFLDAQFRTDADLSLYNDHEEAFHINYLLKSI